MTETRIQQSPLNDVHVASGGRMVEFAGWSMPVQYKGILEEHRAVRSGVGVFDISHMGEFVVSGPRASEWLNRMLTNNVAKLGLSQGQYTLMLNERGGVIDDLLIYRTGETEFFLVVNAARIPEDFAWMSGHLEDGVVLEDRSADFAAVAVQGPKAAELYKGLTGAELPVRNRIETRPTSAGTSYVARTGYTGEDGFEWFLPAVSAAELWNSICAAGAVPCGLGARDTLRLEMCYPLNGSDLSPERTPIEAGLGFFVDLAKGAFMGSEILEAQKRESPAERLTAIVVEGKAPPLRSHYPVWLNDQVVAETSSGALSPSLGYGIALAYLPGNVTPGTAVEIEVRGRRFAGRVVKKPFLKKA